MKAFQWAEKIYLRSFWFIVVGISFAIYYPLIHGDVLLGRDDNILLRPLAGIVSWKEFFAYLVSPLNPDFQPLRDASLMIDVLLVRKWGISVCHPHNLLLWFICCALAIRLARTWIKNEFTLKAWALLFAFHPVYSMTVSWIAARKHLLSLLFMLLALLALSSLRRSDGPRDIAKKATGLCAAYLCSLLSQPIALLFPVWLLFYFLFDSSARDWARRHSAALFVIATAMASLAITNLALNYWHYLRFYHTYEKNLLKLSTLDFTEITPPGEILLATGRYFFQLVVPWKYSVLYSPGSPENIAGLILLPIFLLWSCKIVGPRITLLASAFFLLMLGLVLTKLRTIFISDTYVLNASLAIWFLVISLWQNYRHMWIGWKRHIPAATWLLLAIYFMARSSAEAKTWLSDQLVWKNAFEKEENNCDNSMNYAFFLYSHDLDAEAVKVADIHFLNHCVGQVSRPLYYITIFHHGDISRALKISLLTKETDLNISRLLALAALYVEDHQWNNADRTIAVILEKQPKFWVTSHYIETKPLLNALKSECVSENSPSRYCGLPKMAAQR